MDNREYVYDKSVIQATEYINQGRFGSARDLLVDLLQQYPEDGRLHFLLSVVFRAMENYDEAEVQCHAALENDYAQEACFYVLAKIYEDTEKNKKAEEYYLAALEIEPNDADTLASYGMLMFKCGINDKAEKLMMEALRIDPYNGIALRNKYYMQLSTSKRKLYVESLEKVIQHSGSEVRNHIDIAMHHIMQKNFEHAKESLTQAYLMDPTNKEILEVLNSMETRTSIFYAPIKLIEKLGGGASTWVIAMIAVFGTRAVGLYRLSSIIAMVYIFLCLYSWIIYFVYKIKEKRDK